MTTIHKKNDTLTYLQTGDTTKKPIMIIGSSIYYPKLFSNPIYKNLHFIFVTHIGFTEVSPENSAHSLDDVVNDIELIRAKLNITSMYLLGHSGHGFMAMAYAQKYPQYVLGTILSNLAPTNQKSRQELSINYFEETASPERKAFFYQEIAKLEQDIKDNPNKRFSYMNIRMQAHSFYDFTYAGAYLWDNLPNNMPALDYLWGEAFAEFDTEAFFANWKKPIILLLSDYDYLVAPTNLWDSITQTYNVPVIKFDKSGHNPMLEEPIAYYKTLVDFIQN